METSQRDCSRQFFSACLKKGAVTSLSREAPLCNIGLGPSQDFYSLLGGPLYPQEHVVKATETYWVSTPELWRSGFDRCRSLGVRPKGDPWVVSSNPTARYRGSIVGGP